MTPRLPRGRRPIRLEALDARLTPTGSPELIRDIATGGANSNPQSFAGMGV
jgi:hypothetical protein